MIIQRLEDSKPQWLYINCASVDTSSDCFDWIVHLKASGVKLPIVEEILVLGALLLFGDGQLSPVKDADIFWVSTLILYNKAKG